MKDKIHIIILGQLILAVSFLLGACGKIILFNPKGPIGDSERLVIIVAIALMAIVVIPVFIMAFLFARKYRASKAEKNYDPKWSYSAKIDLVIWLVPLLIVTVLGILAWVGTHRLNPYKPISGNVAPVKIDVVSLDWKWLFIYPDYGIATINQLVIPVRVPLSFRITSDTVMTSFFIPQLGSQIYAMAGMQTRLHLMADAPGVYHGQNQQLSGRGFSYMNFKALAVSTEQFEDWVKKTGKSPDRFDLARFEDIRRPGIGYSVTEFSRVDPSLFDYILNEYRAGDTDTGTIGDK